MVHLESATGTAPRSFFRVLGPDHAGEFAALTPAHPCLDRNQLKSTGYASVIDNELTPSSAPSPPLGDVDNVITQADFIFGP